MTRQPKQDRGRARREQILDAAAALLIEGGEGAVMLHAVAARANASTGSMYHLFRNREQLLNGLVERHYERLRELAPSLDRGDTELWREWTAREVIERLFGYALRYFAANTDALHLLLRMRETGFSEFMEVIDAALALRLGDENARAVSRTLYAVSTGTLFFTQSMSPMDRVCTISRLPDVLAAYLADQDNARIKVPEIAADHSAKLGR